MAVKKYYLDNEGLVALISRIKDKFDEQDRRIKRLETFTGMGSASEGSAIESLEKLLEDFVRVEDEIESPTVEDTYNSID